MPFYIKGLNKNSGKGKVFKANVWFWRPLWCYVCSVCEGILDENDYEEGRWNDGHFVDEEKAKKIAGRLIYLTKNGQMEAYVEEFENYRTNMPAEKCTLCDGAGELNGKCMVCSGQKIAREHAFSEHFIRCRVCDGTGTLVQAECHGCNGRGEREPIASAYPMSVELIKEFTEFCKNSGGFNIF